MFKRKKPRKNYRKGAKRRRRFAFLRRFMIGVQVVAGLATLIATSCFFILIHDVITQCDYFKAKSLKIEGMQRLTTKQIIQQARVREGMNVLAVNLSIVRKRLITHPWIAAAEVRREIPSGLFIRIKEHLPLAIVHLDRKYIINEQGQVFKEWTPSDPDTLPIVNGLQVTDFSIDGKTTNPVPQLSDRQAKGSQNNYLTARPLEAVMQVLILGKQAHSILPNRKIKQIRVDREIGITLQAFKQIKTIVLGYHNYPLKYAMLKNILIYRKQKRNFPDFDRIDLNNVNRIVVNPVRLKTSGGDQKEV
ncbi:MAG: FtsQ-type POTRA domain-containing protein [Desulfobacterales bacterium]